MSNSYPWDQCPLHELEEKGIVSLGRGKIISKIDIQGNPGGYPIYSSSAKGEGLFGKYNDYMFDEELITWSVDGGGHLFYRPRHKFSVTNVSGYMKLDTSVLDYRFAHAVLSFQHSKLIFDYQNKAHPSVIRNLYHLPLPPLPEQKKIAEILSGIDRIIAGYSHKREKLSKLRSALRSDLLSGCKESGVGDCMWSTGTLQDIARPVNDKWTPSQNEDSIPYIGLEHIFPENPKVADYGKSSEVISTKNQFKKSDILFAKLRPYLKKVVLADFAGICSTDIIPVRASAESDSTFLYYLISSSEVIAKAVESSAGNVMPRASWQDIREVEIEIPPLAEQKKIAEILSGVDHQMATLLEAEKKCVSLKQAISSDLLSGRKRVGI